MTEATKTNRARKRICVTDETTRTLIKEFSVTGNTVRWALKFFSDSALSINIRNRAIELMKEVAAENVKTIQEYDQD